MGDGKQDDPSDPSNPMYNMMPLADQLPDEICKMLEKRAQARVAANLEQYAIVCFMVDRLAVKKIKRIQTDLIPTTTSFEVKTPQQPPRSGGREFCSTDH